MVGPGGPQGDRGEKGNEGPAGGTGDNGPPGRAGPQVRKILLKQPVCKMLGVLLVLWISDLSTI